MIRKLWAAYRTRPKNTACNRMKEITYPFWRLQMSRITPDVNAIQVRQHECNGLRKSGWLQREGVSEFAMRRCAAVNARLEIIRTSPFPQKHGLKNPSKEVDLGVLQSLRRRHCRTEAIVFPRGECKKRSGTGEIRSLC